MSAADNTAGADLTDARSPSEEVGAGGVRGGDASAHQPRYGGGIPGIKNTWVRRAALVLFWIAWPFVVAGLFALCCAFGALNGMRLFGRELGDAMKEFGETMADVWPMARDASADIWKRRP